MVLNTDKNLVADITGQNIDFNETSMVDKHLIEEENNIETVNLDVEQWDGAEEM